MSASSGKWKPLFSAHASWLSTSWGEMPSSTAPVSSNFEKSSRYEHIWRVQPGRVVAGIEREHDLAAPVLRQRVVAALAVLDARQREVRRFFSDLDHAILPTDTDGVRFRR